MGIARCTSFGTPRRLRSAVTAVLVLSGGVTWLSLVLSPRLRAAALHTLSRPTELPAAAPAGPFLRSGHSRPPAVTSGPPGHRRKPLLVLLWTEQRAHTGVFLQLHSSSFSNCPVNNCRGTTDRSLLPKADAVLFHGRLLKLQDLPRRRRPQQRFVFTLRESPQSIHLPLKKLDNFFNLTMTYSQEADVTFPYGRTVKGKQEGTLPFFHRRLRPVAWMVSHCHTVSKRERYVSQLRRHISVDTLGDCGTSRCSGPMNHCYHKLAETHLFYLSFENTLCDDYITEKFWLALEAGMVPVVRGPSPAAYRSVAPPHSFIHVEEFTGPKALAAYLVALTQNRTEYLSYHRWRRSHRVQRPSALCDLCHRLGRDGRRSTVQLSKVWDAGTHCHAPLDLGGKG